MEYLGFLISENASFFNAYGNWVLIPLFLLTLVGDHLLQKKNFRSWVRFILRTPLIVFVFVLGSLIYMINFPLKPMVDSLSKVQQNIGEKVQDFQFVNVNTGELYNISDFEGKTIVLNFWGTYCGPCIEEFPDLYAIEEDYSEEVRVIALSDEDKERISRFVERIKSPSIIGSFSSQAWIELESFRPLTIMIDKSGVVREYAFGKKDYNYFKSAIEKYR